MTLNDGAGGAPGAPRRLGTRQPRHPCAPPPPRPEPSGSQLHFFRVVSFLALLVTAWYVALPPPVVDRGRSQLGVPTTSSVPRHPTEASAHRPGTEPRAAPYLGSVPPPPPTTVYTATVPLCFGLPLLATVALMVTGRNKLHHTVGAKLPHMALYHSFASSGPGEAEGSPPPLPLPPSVRIRQLGPDEVEVAALLQYRCFSERPAANVWERFLDSVAAGSEKREIMAGLLQRNRRPDWICLVVERDGVPVACAEAVLRKGKQRYLFNVGVLPEARRSGYGRLVVAAMEDQCPEHVVVADVWQDDEGAKAFWTSMDYQLESLFHHGPGIGPLRRLAGRYVKLNYRRAPAPPPPPPPPPVTSP